MFSFNVRLHTTQPRTQNKHNKMKLFSAAQLRASAQLIIMHNVISNMLTRIQALVFVNVKWNMRRLVS